MLIASASAWADYARQLGAAADACALADPLLPPSRVLETLEGVPLPQSSTATLAAGGLPIGPLTPTRLLRLAASASRKAAVSSRQEIYPRGMAPLHHIGPPRDLTFFDIMEDQTGLRPPLTSLEEAQYVLCTGLFDDSHTPDNYARELALMHARKLDFICANPDLIVHVGETMLYCAGAIAQRYEDEGGRVLQAGKPFAPIYDRALMLAERHRGAPVDLKAAGLDLRKVEHFVQDRQQRVR
jgi:hypothetical protein